MKKLPLLIALGIFIAAVFAFKQPSNKEPVSNQTPNSAWPSPSPLVLREEIFDGISYISVNSKLEVGILAQNLVAPSRIKLTPDGKFLLVTQLTGEVLAFNRTNEGWATSPYQVTKVDTKAPGFPPDEFGLVGLVFSAEYDKNHRAFLLYSHQESAGKYLNRIANVVLEEKNGKLTASSPQVIFQAVTPGNVSHQITDGLGIMHYGKPHLVFLIGEGFKPELAQDESAEAGKLMMIQEDGTYPLGTRPYPNRPKLEALGIRNAYVIAENPYDKDNRWLIADTGPDKYDRLIYTKTASSSGEFKPVNFGWNGQTEALSKAIKDPNFRNVRDMVLYRFPQTRTVTGLAFLPPASATSHKLLAVLFGITGSLQNAPGKEIWQGTLTNLTGQPRITFTPIIKRNPKADGKLGNPVGLEVDPQTNDFFFADILEGRIYQVKNKQKL